MCVFVLFFLPAIVDCSSISCTPNRRSMFFRNGRAALLPPMPENKPDRPVPTLDKAETRNMFQLVVGSIAIIVGVLYMSNGGQNISVVWGLIALPIVLTSIKPVFHGYVLNAILGLAILGTLYVWKTTSEDSPLFVHFVFLTVLTSFDI